MPHFTDILESPQSPPRASQSDILSQDRTVTLGDFVSMQEHNVRAVTDQLVEKNREVTRHIGYDTVE